jgi:hypothetical protein
MSYGTIKVDTITFTAGGVDTSVTVSGLVQNPQITGNVTLTGTLQATNVVGTTLVSGATVTGTTANFAGTLTATSGVFASGTAAAPSVSVGATDNGLYSPGTDQVAISTNGTGRLFVDSSGNVRIASGSTWATSDATFQLGFNGNDAYATTYFDAHSITVGAGTSYKNRIRISGTGADNNITFHVGTSSPNEVMRLDGSGRLGLGTSSPDTLLTCSTTDNTFAARFKATNGVFRILPFETGLGVKLSATNGNEASFANFVLQGSSHQFVVGTDTAVTIDSSQRVGIGTSSPQKLLEISAGTANGPVLRLNNSNTNVPVDEEYGRIEWYANDLSSGGTGISAYIANYATNSGVQGALTFGTRTSSNATEKVRITHDGNVGIGTTGPISPLTISDSSGAALSIVTADTNYSGVDIGTNGSSYAFIEATKGGTGSYWPLSIWTGGQRRVDVDTSGRLLVGTSSARANLYNGAVPAQVQSENVGSTAVEYLATRVSNDTYGGSICLVKARGASAGSVTIAQSGDQIGVVSYQGSDGSKFVEAASIGAVVDNTPGSNDMPGRLVFSTTADGASSTTERMRITNAGGFKVTNNGVYSLGTATTHEINHDQNNSAAFHVYHTGSSPYGHYIKFTNANPNNTTNYVFTSLDNTGANIYTINSNGTVTARSDAKFKKNIETTRDGYLDDLAQLRVVKYNWINHEEDAPKELGFIAQEVEQVFPGLVDTKLDKDSKGVETGEVSKSIKTSVFTPMLVKALQEALQRIETLEAKVAALEAP